MWLQIFLQDGAKKDSSGQGVMRAIICPLWFPVPYLEDRAKLPSPNLLECLCRQAISSLPPSLPFLLQCLDMPTSYCCLAPLQIPASFRSQSEGKRQSACFRVPQSIASILVPTPQESQAWQLGSRSWKLLVCSTWLDRMMEWTFGNSDVLQGT